VKSDTNTYKSAAIYDRIHNRGEGETTWQIEACRRYAEANNYQVVAEFVEERSRATLDRPKLGELRDLLETGKLAGGVVIVYSLDRLARNTSDTLLLLVEFRYHDVELKCVSVPLNANTAWKLSLSMLPIFAEHERSRLVDRVRSRGSKRAS
jgi:site-specific DNA recombinase